VVEAGGASVVVMAQSELAVVLTTAEQVEVTGLRDRLRRSLGPAVVVLERL